MAAKGSCVRTISKDDKKGITLIKFELTSDANGDADGDTQALGPTFFTTLNGIMVGCKVTWDDATASYDLFLYDSTGFDWFCGLGVDMAGDHTDADHLFCPVHPTNATNHGSPIIFIDQLVEIVGADMGNVQDADIVIQMQEVVTPRWR